jgi:ABC-type nitrate/sulfonate/bicarbonate transport system substrate-binding protein
MTCWLRLGAAVAASSLILSGCGGSAAGGASAGSDASGTPTLTVADTNGAPLYFLEYGAQQGFFDDAGVHLDIQSSQGGAAAIPGLISGDVDVAGSNVVSALIAASKGLPVQMVAGGTSTSEDPEQDFSALMVPADSPVTGIGQLAGKKIAVNSLKNINDIVLGSMLEKAGLSYDSVEFVELPFPDMAAAVADGNVAAAMIIEPFVTAAEQQGLKIIGRPYSDLRPGLQIGTYLMTEQAITERPEVVQAFQDGVQATADAIAADPGAFRSALPAIGKVDPQLAQEVRINLWRGSDDRDSIDLIQGLMVDYDLIDAPVDLASVIVG